jgi:NAD(P)-dependent dehydrogenase (short-subunit alcohol dehydrogenase family)
MSDQTRPVIVYGASGYTGRLICEYLRQYGVPFIAAGRDEQRLKDSMASNVPGIETADFEVRAVDHEVGALTQLFSGAQVVINTVGPFSKYGPTVVEAALAADVHYSDTTGEQDWLLTCEAQYGEQFAQKGKLLAPGVAQMYTIGEIAANLCLEKPGLDTLDIAVFWGGSPTIASTQTILVNAATAKAYYLERNAYTEFDPNEGLVPLVVPGQHELAMSLPWGGTSHPVWFKNDPRVANVKAQGGVFNTPLMRGVPVIVADALERTKDMSPAERDAVLTETAAQVMSEMPPRENPLVNKSLDSVHASGPLGRAHCVIHGNSNYQQTGLLQAYAAYALLQQPPRRVGFASGCQAFGHRELLGVLREFGLVAQPVLTVQD